jgi:hypothetical protein
MITSLFADLHLAILAIGHRASGNLRQAASQHLGLEKTWLPDRPPATPVQEYMKHCRRSLRREHPSWAVLVIQYLEHGRLRSPRFKCRSRKARIPEHLESQTILAYKVFPSTDVGFTIRFSELWGPAQLHGRGAGIMGDRR